MNELLTTLLLLSASGSVLGLLLILARRVSGKRLPSTLWYYVWLPVLLRLVLPLPGLIPGAQTSTETTPAAVLMQAETSEKRSYRYDGYGEYFAFGTKDEETETPAAEAVANIETASEAETTAPTQPRIQPGVLLKSPGFWLAVWLIGAVLCFTRYTAGYVRFRRVLMRTLQTTDGQTARVYKALNGLSDPRLFASVYVKTPMLLGLYRPLIVLPQGEFSEESARNVLRHELTHYRRGDLYIKWFFVFVASLHWFNPLMPLFRRELDRVCELSCDENVLVRMEPSERRSYGETLLDLASNRTLPAGVVATTFATEKHVLKERLEQIMKFKYKPRAILALTLAALLLMGAIALAAAPARAAGASAEPAPAPGTSTGSAESSAEVKTVNVSTVDEFLAAIGSDVNIVLAPGTYDLSTASDYGGEGGEYYRWEEENDGYELSITGVENLSVTADSDDPAATVLAAVPRYADVLAFVNCQSIDLAGFTAGHTKEQGSCAGGVIHLVGTDNVTVSNCALYGCGVLGVQAENCRNIDVRDTDIYECSSGAVELNSCMNVRFDGCDFRDCYDHYGDTPSPAFTMFNISNCRGVAITDGHVYGNYVYDLVHVYCSQEVYLLGTLFEENRISDEFGWYAASVFSVEGDPVVVAGCEFRDEYPIFSGDVNPAVDLNGDILSYDALDSMKQTHVDFPGFAAPAEIALERTLNAEGLYEVHVSTVDEFLASIAPDTVIYLDEGLYDLSQAANYGSYSSQYYYWADLSDGPCLVIAGVENLSIVGAGKDETRIEALPRYADVLGFDDCRNVSVRDLTAGHTLGAGMCVGAVLEFWGCEGVDVSGCGLFGCGTYGVLAQESTDISVVGNEIYECSSGAVQLSLCMDAVFADNYIHDCAYPTYRFGVCVNITIDGETVEEEAFAAADPGFAEYVDQEASESVDSVMQAIAERGTVIYAADLDIPGAGPYKNAAAQG